MRAVAVESRERNVLAGASFAGRGRDRLEARQAIGRIGLEACLRLFAVADDIDAEVGLCLHDGSDRLGGLAGQFAGVIRLPCHSGKQQRGERIGTRQAAGMRRQDSPVTLIEPRHHGPPLGVTPPRCHRPA